MQTEESPRLMAHHKPLDRSASGSGAIADNKRLGSVLAMIRDEQLRREPGRRSGPRRRDQRDARLFKVG
jgi:hypothetical protein